MTTNYWQLKYNQKTEKNPFFSSVYTARLATSKSDTGALDLFYKRTKKMCFALSVLNPATKKF